MTNTIVLCLKNIKHYFRRENKVNKDTYAGEKWFIHGTEHRKDNQLQILEKNICTLFIH